MLIQEYLSFIKARLRSDLTLICTTQRKTLRCEARIRTVCHCILLSRRRPELSTPLTQSLSIKGKKRATGTEGQVPGRCSWLQRTPAKKRIPRTNGNTFHQARITIPKAVKAADGDHLRKAVTNAASHSGVRARISCIRRRERMPNSAR